MFTYSLGFQRQYAADRQEQLRRQAGATRLRRQLRNESRRERPRQRAPRAG